MDFLKTAREQLGITQADLAALLRCTRSHLAHVETGDRGFSQESKMIAQLAQKALLAPLPARAKDANAKLPEAAVKWLKKEIRIRKLKISKRVLALESLEPKITQANNLQHFATVLLQSSNTLPELSVSTLQVLFRQAGEKAAKLVFQQVKTRVEINNYQAFIDDVTPLLQ